MTLQRINHESVPEHLHGTIICSPSSGLPRPCAMIWTSLNEHRYSPKHLRNHLRAISLLYIHCNEFRHADDLDTLLIEWKFEELEELLKSYLAKIQNQSTQTGVNYSELWKMALDFVILIANVMNHRSHSQQEKLKQVRLDLLNLERLYKYIQPRKNTKVAKIRSLPANVVNEILELLTPGNVRNPFRTEKLQWRNFTIALLLLHQGLRRGEIALLRSDSLRHEYAAKANEDVFWLNIRETDLFDTRSRKPQIKNAQSERQIPVSKSLAKVVNYYIVNWRGRCKHGFLFSSSQNSPLSNRSFNYVFERLSDALSDVSIKELEIKIKQRNVSLHNLRHTCAVVRLHIFLEQNNDNALAEQLMREFFGWSKDSQMPRRYAKAYYNTKLQDIWAGDEFDEHFVGILAKYETSH